MFCFLPKSTCSISSDSSTATGFSSKAKNTATPITCGPKHAGWISNLSLIILQCKLFFTSTCYPTSSLTRCRFQPKCYMKWLINTNNVTHLQRLQYKDALEKGEAQRHDPLDGLFFAIFKAVQQGEVSGHSAEGQQEEPAQEHTPPGQPAAGFALRLLLNHKRRAEPRTGCHMTLYPVMFQQK